MNLKTIATLAATIIATSAYAGHHEEQKGSSCGKKEANAKGTKEAKGGASGAEQSCGKKESSCSKKEASCSKKESSCSKKEASCAKK